ncbi:MAG: GAF domain-containing protein [Magnetococcales bacterium]|nr:GAF domain-containing protein [Magnetococcales bacterium]
MDDIDSPDPALEPILALIHRLASTGEHSRLLQELVDLLPDILEAERCVFFLYDPDNRRLRFKAGTGMCEQELDSPLEGAVGGKSVLDNVAVVINDPRLFTKLRPDLVDDQPIRNLLSVPVRNTTGEVVRGVLQVMNKRRGGVFTPRDQQLMERVTERLHGVVKKLYLSQQNRLSRSREPGWREQLLTPLGMMGLAMAAGLAMAGLMLWLG